jgi:cell division protease FtsH
MATPATTHSVAPAVEPSARQWETLEKAAATLKAEFFGLDEVIDRIIASISGWFFFSGIQDRPCIVNLWGLTGVGKTAVVRRLSELLGFSQHSFRINLAEQASEHFTIRNEAFGQMSGKPAILILDEFQHFRTKDESGNEKEHKSFVWDLLDSGRVDITKVPDEFTEVSNLARDLKTAVESGVQSAGNHVTSGREILRTNINYLHYWQVMPNTIGKLHYRGCPLIPETFLEVIRKLAEDRFPSVERLKEAMATLDARGIIALLQSILKGVKFTQTVDCRQTLIFVIGNIDELHREANDLNPDLDPDLFRERTRNFTTSNVKTSLLRRFRAEQIARLGNVHIIYPSIGSEAYRRIIAAELSRLSKRTLGHCGLEVTFDPSVHEFLYRDGVVPSQGTRPLFSTIHSHLGTNIGKVLAEREKIQIQSRRIHFRYGDSMLHADFLSGEALSAPCHHLALPLERHIEADRAYVPSRESSLISVHEAAHAVVSMAYNGQVPHAVTVNSAENRGEGYVEVSKEMGLLSRTALIGRIAVCLAGALAEKAFFGEANVSLGSGSDIAMATDLATLAIRKNGCGKDLARFAVESSDKGDYSLQDRDGEVQEEILALIEGARKVCGEILTGEREFLVHLAKRVFECGRLHSIEIREIAREHGGRLVNGEPLFPLFDYQAALMAEHAQYGGAQKIAWKKAAGESGSPE